MSKISKSAIKNELAKGFNTHPQAQKIKVRISDKGVIKFIQHLEKIFSNVASSSTVEKINEKEMKEILSTNKKTKLLYNAIINKGIYDPKFNSKLSYFKNKFNKSKKSITPSGIEEITRFLMCSCRYLGLLSAHVLLSFGKPTISESLLMNLVSFYF